MSTRHGRDTAVLSLSRPYHRKQHSLIRGAKRRSRPSSRWKWCSEPKVRSTTQGAPRSEPCSVWRRAICGALSDHASTRVRETDAIARSAMPVELATATVSDLPQAACRKPTGHRTVWRAWSRGPRPGPCPSQRNHCGAGRAASHCRGRLSRGLLMRRGSTHFRRSSSPIETGDDDLVHQGKQGFVIHGVFLAVRRCRAHRCGAPVDSSENLDRPQRQRPGSHAVGQSNTKPGSGTLSVGSQ
jgi:hypothetical protein